MSDGKFILNPDGKFNVNADGKFDQCAVCCFCKSDSPVLSVTLAGIDANRCTPCHQTGFSINYGEDVTALAVNGTYAVPTLGPPSSSWPATLVDVDSGYAHVKAYNVAAGVCTTFIEESDSYSLDITILLDCSDVNDLGNPRILLVAISIEWPGGFPATVPGVNGSLFGYVYAADGTPRYVGDGSNLADQNGTNCAGLTSHSGTVQIGVA